MSATLPAMEQSPAAAGAKRPDEATSATADISAAADTVLDRAVDYLIDQQSEAGWWKAELETTVTLEAEDLLLRHFLGISDKRITSRTAAWIRSGQLEDGTWNIYHGGPSDLSATIEAYVALRMAGDPADADHMQRAARRVREMGGLGRSRVFTRIWMALVGQWSWDDLPALPPEVILLPPRFPLNIYSFASWARQTIVPLTVVASFRPSRSLGFDLTELDAGKPPREPGSLRDWAGRFHLLDRALHVYEKFPIPILRRHARRVAAEWIVKRQEADGCWGGIQPPWVYSIMALHLLGYPMDHPVIKKGLDNLETFAINDGDTRRFEACQSPVWDTGLAGFALNEAGASSGRYEAKGTESLERAARWLLAEEVRVPGDWAVSRPDLEPGGWAFEFENDNYPDLDDTAEVIMALRGSGLSKDPETAAAVEAAVRRAINWTFGMQCRDGGWAAFDVDNTSALCAQLPFCDFGEVTDPPSADVTAHVVEMLAGEGMASDRRTQRAVEWLLDHQETDGSWFGRWGVNHVYGTGAVVPALIRAGTPADGRPIRRAVEWLEAHQNHDGGWGEDPRSYDRGAEGEQWRGRGNSTPSQTAWALLALIAAAGETRTEAIERGVRWLCENQRDDGGWDEAEFTGTGFPRDFYLRYHLYRQVFPIMALGRYLRRPTLHGVHAAHAGHARQEDQGA